MTTSNADCLSSLALDRLAVGELDGDVGSAPRAHIAACARCSDRFDEIRQLSGSFPDEVWVDGLVQTTHKRLRAHSRGRLAMWSGLAAAAAVLVLLVIPRGGGDGGAGTGAVVPPGTDTVRLKGGFDMTLIARRADGTVEHLLPSAQLHPGDAIRFSLSVPAAGYVSVVGIDAAGVVTPYAPASGEAVWVDVGKDQVLEGSIVLDDTLGAERIVAVLCQTTTTVADVVASAERALSAAGGDPRQVAQVGGECAESSVLIEKVPLR